MTGSGTVADPYVVMDVNDLQAMDNDLTAHYILGQDIDASDTITWNGGLGFSPLGGYELSQIVRPTGDNSQIGIWIPYPSDGVYWDKVNEVTPDDITTYACNGEAAGDWDIYFNHGGFAIPSDAIITAFRIVMQIGIGTTTYNGLLKMGAVDYVIGQTFAFGWKIRTIWQNTNPATGNSWTPSEANGSIDAIGVRHQHPGGGYGYVSQLYAQFDYDRPLRGTFNGYGHTISNLYINRPTRPCTGLFSYSSGAAIQNVNLKNVNITGGAGYYVGALVGLHESSSTSRCSSSGTVVGSGAAYCIGGLIGRNMNIAASTITECFSTANVNSANGGIVGGLVGTNGCVVSTPRATITDCYARGNVSGPNWLGSLVGEAGKGSDIIRSFGTGSVPPATNYGGLSGIRTLQYRTQYCVFDKDTTGCDTDSGEGTGSLYSAYPKTTSQMKKLNTFSSLGWNIRRSAVDLNDGYPFLGWKLGGSPTWLIKGLYGNIVTDQLKFQHAERLEGRI